MQWHLYSRETTVIYNSSLVCRLVCCTKCIIYMNNTLVQWANEVKHLGNIVQSSLSDDGD